MIAIRPAKDVGCSSDGGVGIGELEKISKIFDVFWRQQLKDSLTDLT